MRLSKTHTTWDHFVTFVHRHAEQLHAREARVRTAMIRDGIGQRLYVVAEVLHDETMHDVWVLCADTKKGVTLTRGLDMQRATFDDVCDVLRGQTLNVVEGFFVHMERVDQWV